MIPLRRGLSILFKKVIPMEKCNGCGEETIDECSECARPLCASVGEGCSCVCLDNRQR